MRPLLKVLVATVTAVYPALVYFGFGRLSPAHLGLSLTALMLVRAWAGRSRVWLLAAAGTAFLSLASVLGGSWIPLKLYPAMVSSALLLVFGASVLYPPTVVERLARLREPDLPPEASAYTRKVTLVWCGFFVLNGLASLATVLWASDEVWLLYNGLLSYLLMGLLFAAEWLCRPRAAGSPSPLAKLS